MKDFDHTCLFRAALPDGWKNPGGLFRAQRRKPKQSKLDAWKRSGHTFVGPGLGLQAAFSKNSGPLAEFRFMQYLSPEVPVIALQLGYAIGF